MKNLLLIVAIFLFSISIYAQYNNMSKEELRKKAKEMGYDVDEEMSQEKQSPEIPGKDFQTKTQQQVIIEQPKNKPLESFILPSFADRDSAKNLPAFGYNIFTNSPTTFEPSLNVPVPSNYVVGPGDEIVVTLWGETQLVHKVTVNKEGNIYIPNAGLINVSGLSLAGLRNKIHNRLSETYSSLNVSASGGGTSLDVSTGTLRSVKVFVLGEVNTPGGYTLPALSTSFTALYYSGGPTLNGSLRNVQVQRNGKVISNIDLYDYIINGDKSKDVRLEDEDIIFIPPVGERAAVAGNVFRPAIYELKKDETLKDLLKFSGGLTFNAYFKRIHIERIIPFDQRDNYVNDILDIDLNFSSVNELVNSNFDIADGDVITISGINKKPENMVVISGNVRKPGVYELTNSVMTVRDLVYRADSLFTDAFLAKAVLIRTLPNEKKEIITFNLEKALKGDPFNNIALQNRDEIQIYKEENFYPVKKVQISGAVKNPGEYNRFENMTLTELIILAGGLTDDATTKEIEIARLDTTSSTIYADKFSIDLPVDYWNRVKSEDFVLKDFDRVLIKKDPAKVFEKNVFIKGEVMYPGSYTILYEGERLTDFIKRSGGFKNTAYKEGIYLKRDTPILQRVSTFDVIDSLNKENPDQPLYDRPLYDREKFMREFSQRIPILWDEIEDNDESIYNIKLEAGDTLIIPKDPRVVYVAGEVGIPSAVPYTKGASLSYYINQAGGYTETSSKGEEIVIGPNGKKWAPSGWFFIPNPEIESGSTVIVPAEVESESDAWPVIRDVVSILSASAVLVLTVINLTK